MGPASVPSLLVLCRFLVSPQIRCLDKMLILNKSQLTPEHNRDNMSCLTRARVSEPGKY